MVIEMFKKLMAIFNRKQKIHLLFLGVMIFIGGIVETLGVSAMLPVISVILDQESLQEYEIVGTMPHRSSIHFLHKTRQKSPEAYVLHDALPKENWDLAHNP